MGGTGSGRPRKRGRKKKTKTGVAKHQSLKQKGATHGKLARQEKVASLILKKPDMTQKEMADYFGVSGRTISNDIIEIEERYVDNATKDVQIEKSKVVRRLEYALAEAHVAWEKSKAVQKSTKTKEKEISGGKQGGSTEEEKVEQKKQTPGDVRFLQEFKDIAIEIASYQGVDKLEGTNNLNVNINMPSLPGEYDEFGLNPNKEVKEEDDAGSEDVQDADFEDVDDDE